MSGERRDIRKRREKMEAAQDQRAQTDCVENPRARSDGVVLLAQGLLARLRLPDSYPRPAQRLLGQTGPQGIHQSLPPHPGCQANRRMRTRTSGGVRGAGVSPAPTRSSASNRGKAQALASGPRTRRRETVAAEPVSPSSGSSSSLTPPGGCDPAAIRKSPLGYRAGSRALTLRRRQLDRELREVSGRPAAGRAT